MRLLAVYFVPAIVLQECSADKALYKENCYQYSQILPHEGEFLNWQQSQARCSDLGRLKQVLRGEIGAK